MNKLLILAIFLLLFTLGTAAQNKKISRAVQISPKMLRQQLMRDGLRRELNGCPGILSAVDITSQKIDLNNDGQPEILATAVSGCFGAHGSKVWVYRVTRGRLAALLTMTDGAFETTSGSTNGFRDITLVAGTAIVVYKYTYKYGGNRYRYTGGKRYQRNQSGELVLQEILNP